MTSRRTILTWGAATAAALLLPIAYQRGLTLAKSTPRSRTGRIFGYVPFTQPLFIPEFLTPLKGSYRLNPQPGLYPRDGGTRRAYPCAPTGRMGDVSHGIAPEFGMVQEWNRRRSGFSPYDSHEQEFLLVTEETTNRFVPGGPDVPVFTYRDGTKPPGSGRSPGPTMLAEYLAPTVLRSANGLTKNRSGVNTTHHDVETSIHLHGSHGTAHGDGFPDFYVLAGEARDYFYPNIAPKETDPGSLVAPIYGGEYDTTWIPTTQWYHDHTMDITGFTVTMGLAGFYLLLDDRQRELAEMGVLPPIGGHDAYGGPLDLALAIADQRFNADGTLFYDFLDHNGRLGDVFTVNGVVQPMHKVERRKYRLRFLNASNARVYEIRLSNRQKMSIIGADSWQFPRAVEVESFELAQGQRYDVIVDFRDAPDEVYLENIMLQKDGRGPKEVDPRKARDLLLKFEVHGPNSSEMRVVDGVPIRGYKGIDPGGQFAFERDDEIVATRRFDFDRSNGGWTINNRLFNPRRADAVPQLGYGAERWMLSNNSGGWWHPAHPHLEGFQIRKINGRPPRRERQFNSDLVALAGNTVAEIYIKFRTFTGPYVFHCHAMEHEDMRMMAIVDPTAGPNTGNLGAMDATGPLDGEARIHPDVSGVVPDCADLEREHRIYFNDVGDREIIQDRGIGLDCQFDMTRRGNRG